MNSLNDTASLQDVISQINALTVAVQPLVQSQATHGQSPSPATASGASSTSLGSSGAHSNSVSSRTQLQDSYESVKDSVASVQLPATWKLRESPRGISAECKDAYYVVKDSAKYTETALKYITSVDQENITKEDINNICLVLRAQLEFLGDKYATLRVKSTSKNKAVGTLFESQLAGTSGFSDRHLDAWQQVSQIAANGGFQLNENRDARGGRGRGRGFRGQQRGGFRGQQRGGYGHFNNYLRDIPDHRNEAEP